MFLAHNTTPYRKVLDTLFSMGKGSYGEMSVIIIKYGKSFYRLEVLSKDNNLVLSKKGVLKYTPILEYDCVKGVCIEPDAITEIAELCADVLKKKALKKDAAKDEEEKRDILEIDIALRMKQALEAEGL